MNKIAFFLLSLRDNIIFKAPCAYILLNNEFSMNSVSSYTFTNGLPTIELNDGTKLSSFEDLNLPNFKKYNIPKTHLSCVFSYILRYKYPHFSPDRVINTFPFYRKIFPSLIHRQHLNTFYDLKNVDKKLLADRFKLKENDTVLELGSFMGFGTVKMSRLVGNFGKVISVEADKRAFSNLNLNLKSNSIKNVVTINCAVSENNDEKKVIYKGGYQKNTIIKNVIQKSEVQYVEGKTIETLCSEHNIKPSFIIMTINGAELRVLQKSREYLKNFSNLRIIVPGWYKDENGVIGYRIVHLLKLMGFDTYHTNGLHIFAIKE